MTSALFSVTDPSGKTTSTTFQFPAGAQYPICAFQVNLVGPGSSGRRDLRPAGRHRWAILVSSGSLADQGGGPGLGVAREVSGFTGELSNAIYGPLTPASGPSINQSLSGPSAGPAHKLAR